MSKSLPVHMTIPASSEFVGVVRLAISGIATRMDFSVEDIEDIKIAVSEACTNSVQHAYEGQNTVGQIDITCQLHPDKLEITVKDSGAGFDTDIIGSPQQQEKSHKKLGLGLGITFIKSLMDDATITSTPGKGTTVVMSKQVPQTNAQAA